MPAATLVVTLKISAESQAFFDFKRAEHFPAHINYLKAHCTLFHKLPNVPGVIDIIRNASIRPPFEMRVVGLRSIGNGVVYDLESDELQRWHAGLQKNLHPTLIPQDKQKLKPHITIQNKVTAFKASKLLEQLQGSFRPFTVPAIGCSTWLYMNGPWQHLSDYDFG